MDTKRKYVNLVITGNPGVGKHTIAELFLKYDASYQILDINKFAIEPEYLNVINLSQNRVKTAL